MKKLETRKYLTKEKMTKCFCPRCENEHKSFMYWRGKGTPKVFCQECKKLIYYNQIGDNCHNEINSCDGLVGEEHCVDCSSMENRRQFRNMVRFYLDEY